jgi:hypothetical protein
VARGASDAVGSDVGSDPLLVVLTQAVSDSHQAGLRQDGVSYLFAGAR